jgi:hypothetical protein
MTSLEKVQESLVQAAEHLAATAAESAEGGGSITSTQQALSLVQSSLNALKTIDEINYRQSR